MPHPDTLPAPEAQAVFELAAAYEKMTAQIGKVIVGQKGVIRVTVLQGIQQYAGTTRNGVTSGGYGAFGGSYTIAAVQ